MARLYPNGWPANMRASLYLNNKRRDKFLPPVTQGAEWASGTWYQVGDEVTYSAVTYRCTTTHQAGTRTPDIATEYWAEVV